MSNSIAKPAKQHPFEAAGLGLAPFRCIGAETRVGPIRLPGGIEVGAPGQPMGTCDFCGTGIAECYVIRSSDGKQFIVGCDCVAKTYKTAGEDLPADFVRAKRQRDAVKRGEKRQRDMRSLQARVVAAQAILAASPTLFMDRPHPFDFHAKQGKMLRDYYSYLLQNGSEASKRDTVKRIESAGDAPSAEQVAAIVAERAAALEAERTALAAAEQAKVDAAAALAAQKAASQHVGAEGERITLDAIMEGVVKIPVYDNYGRELTRYLVKFRDLNGNALVWFTSAPPGAFDRTDEQHTVWVPVTEGQQVRLVGTVKRHGEYQGEKNTALLRVKFPQLVKDARATRDKVGA